MPNHNSNYPDIQAAIFAMTPSPQFLQEAWALPCWRQLPYRSVEVTLPDGSCFQLRTPDLAVKAARIISIPGSEPMTYLLEQVLPLVQERPEFLIEVASRLTWGEARALAREAFWRSPCMMLAGHFKNRARMSLHT
ncbi:hypothetical protein WJ96_06130 [Burkholderia ubonensis]|uniref:Uncharacterized protein n=1 Tax=Burkholderia ubonensis TaxID=101571 RepID=A0AAW3MYU4_9BURK|nr:hypothetical protein [Burkholderia ubonensis]KVP75336.1 hypothetical protein WJ93_07935 [Burkholderia ubonensis]KVP96804.1 hypothetical protein WJ97_13065 [Burkholderia ubonensis]KVP98147.1 hypothetical protein WJ96_06130 [Burkholderia ubonensis]KVZ92845.1 hypothetical protein WL25_17795 [Burkholderia ubonensis]